MIIKGVKFMSNDNLGNRVNKDEYVYCTKCIYFRLDDEGLPYCLFEDECNINNCEDSMRFEDRPYYKSTQELLELKDKTLNFRNKYKNKPIAFAEDMYGVKLYPWQKALLNAWNGVEKCKQYIYNILYRHEKQMLAQAQLEYMKTMEMDFYVWKLDCIEVYEKGVLVRTIREENEL